MPFPCFLLSSFGCTTTESDEDFEARKQKTKYAKAVKGMYADMLEAMSGEAANLLRQVTDNNGAKALEIFTTRWGGSAITSCIALLDQLLDYQPKRVSIGAHCTGWADLVLKLRARNVELDQQLESLLFLRTLPKTSKMQSFVTHQKLDPKLRRGTAEVRKAVMGQCHIYRAVIITAVSA